MQPPHFLGGWGDRSRSQGADPPVGKENRRPVSLSQNRIRLFIKSPGIIKYTNGNEGQGLWVYHYPQFCHMAHQKEEPKMARREIWKGFVVLYKKISFTQIHSGSQPFGTCVPPNQSCNPSRTPKSNLYPFAYPHIKIVPIFVPPH